MKFREALTFDDVSLEPAASKVLPGETDIRSRVTKSISLGIPLLSAAMDTVTEANLAIAMAQAGGMGVIHKNFDAEAQADEVRRVKKFEAGMVVDPLTISPERPVRDALRLKEEHGISGIPVVEDGTHRLVGILTNRDVRFETNLDRPVGDVMTRENLVTVREDVGALCDFAGHGARPMAVPSWLVKPALKLFEALKLSPLYRWVYETADRDSFVSTDRIERELAWSPKYSNAQALIRSYEWYLANKVESDSGTGITHRVAWNQGILKVFKAVLR